MRYSPPHSAERASERGLEDAAARSPPLSTSHRCHDGISPPKTPRNLIHAQSAGRVKEGDYEEEEEENMWCNILPEIGRGDAARSQRCDNDVKSRLLLTKNDLLRARLTFQRPLCRQAGAAEAAANALHNSIGGSSLHLSLSFHAI